MPSLYHNAWLTPAACAILQSQSRRGGAVFPAVARLAPTGDLSVWRAARRAAGLTGVWLHDLRHTLNSMRVTAPLPRRGALADAARVNIWCYADADRVVRVPDAGA